MDFRNRRAIHDRAADALAHAAGHEKKLIFVYCGVTTLMSLLGLVVTYILDLQIAETGGLSNIGLRSVLSTAQYILPIAQTVVSACLGFSYQMNILRIARGQNADYRTLPQGFRHFFVLLRLSLLEGLVYFAIGFFAMQLSSVIFSFTPFAQVYYEVMEPLMESVSVLGTVPALDEATTYAVLDACMPAVWIFLAVFLILAIPIYFQYRMSMFALADEPRKGALYALHKSRVLLRRNRLELLKLDFTMWWFYLLQLVITLVLYADLLLPLLGVALPWSQTASLYIFNIASLILQFAVYYFTMNRVNVTYAVSYDALQQPREPDPAPEEQKPLPFQTDF